jgi:electron transfer flavoprotein alpha subunit
VALTETLASLVADLVAGEDYIAIATGDTPFGREFAARLAVRLDVPVISPVLSVRFRNGQLQAVRPARAGAATAVMEPRRLPAILVMHADAGGAGTEGAARADSFEYLGVAGGEVLFELLHEERPGPWEMDVAEADVVVAGGRGVGPEGFAMLGELAALLGGSVAGTRVAVDSGWTPYARQVGLTGRSVAPRLYVACGISGAIHHTLGMRESSFIIAINSDPQAPIFKIANVSIVGDVHKIVPALISDLRSHQKGKPSKAGLAEVLA